MKFHLFNLLLLIITICFFQSTSQYRISKRQFTEDHLVNFIISTCSPGQKDFVIQNLCYQTMESALIGGFPYLVNYCEKIDSEADFCRDINKQIALRQDIKEERLVNRRHVRSLNQEEVFTEQIPKMDYQIDVELNSNIQLCMKKLHEKARDAFEFCFRTLEERYSEIDRLCKKDPKFDYCQLVGLPTPPYYRLLASSHSAPTKVKPLIFSSPNQKQNADNASHDQENIKSNEQDRSAAAIDTTTKSTSS